MLGLLLAFNAGAVNAGGFLVVHMYTSHMTGFASQLRNPGLAAAASILMGIVLVVLTLAQLAASRAGERKGKR